jgi:hypothetical protein
MRQLVDAMVEYAVGEATCEDLGKEVRRAFAKVGGIHEDLGSRTLRTPMP